MRRSHQVEEIECCRAVAVFFFGQMNPHGTLRPPGEVGRRGCSVMLARIGSGAWTPPAQPALGVNGWQEHGVQVGAMGEGLWSDGVFGSGGVGFSPAISHRRVSSASVASASPQHRDHAHVIDLRGSVGSGETARTKWICLAAWRHDRSLHDARNGGTLQCRGHLRTLAER